MSNIPFYVPKLQEKGVWYDWRGSFGGGYGWRHNIALSGIKKVAVHHSVTTPTKNAAQDVQTIYNIHVNGNGWGGIGYNFIITSEEKNGFAKVAYVGDLGSARAHTANSLGAHGIPAGYGNNHIVGILFIGSFHTGKLPTTAQLRSAHYLVEELIFKENARLTGLTDTWSNLKGHQEFDQTACPSNQLSKLKALIVSTVEPKPPVAKPYKVTNLATPKQVRAIRNAKIWDLNFKTWGEARSVGVVEKGTVFSVSQIADHNLGSRYYLYKNGGVNKVDVENYTNPPVVTPQPDPEDLQQVPDKPTQDNTGTTDGDMQGVKDSLSRIEAIVTQILDALKKVFNLGR